MEKNTACECPLAGFCNRHGIKKSAHLHKLCQTSEKYFNMWENCQGPGQHFVNCDKKESAPPVVEQQPEPVQTQQTLPPLKEQATNFIKSAAKHVVSGLKSSPKEVQEQRMAICSSCEFFIKDSMRCGACGCYLATKTRWDSSTCPKGKW